MRFSRLRDRFWPRGETRRLKGGGCPVIPNRERFTFGGRAWNRRGPRGENEFSKWSRRCASHVSLSSYRGKNVIAARLLPAGSSKAFALRWVAAKKKRVSSQKNRSAFGDRSSKTNRNNWIIERPKRQRKDAQTPQDRPYMVIVCLRSRGRSRDRVVVISRGRYRVILVFYAKRGGETNSCARSGTYTRTERDCLKSRILQVTLIVRRTDLPGTTYDRRRRDLFLQRVARTRAETKATDRSNKITGETRGTWFRSKFVPPSS